MYFLLFVLCCQYRLGSAIALRAAIARGYPIAMAPYLGTIPIPNPIHNPRGLAIAGRPRQYHCYRLSENSSVYSVLLCVEWEVKLF